MTKKIILALVATFATIGLNAAGTTVEKLHDHYSSEANKTDNPMVKGLEDKASKPTQRAKNLNDAVERWSNGKASEADKELIKVEDGPFIKRLQDETVYRFQIDIENPSYHFIASGGAMVQSVIAIAIDLYMIQHCTNDLSKITPDDFQKVGATREYGQLWYMKYQNLDTSKDSYKKYVQAVRAFTCGDGESLKNYLQKDNEYEGTFVAGLLKEDMGDKPVFISYKNEVGNECVVLGHTTATIPSLYEKPEIKLEKETCKSGEAFIVNGYATKMDGNLIFSNILPGGKVKIIKTK